MKADPTDLTRLLDLQSLDTALAQVKHKASTLPVHQTIAVLMQKRADAADELIAAKTALSDSEAAAVRAEEEVVPVRERLARNQARVDAGAMDPKALSNALDEIEHLKQRVSDLEDAQLEAMDAQERAASHVGELSQDLERIERELRSQVNARDAEVSDLAAEAKSLTEARDEKAAQIDGALLTLYDKIRTRAGGVGVARFERGRCSGCGLQATVADSNAYMSAPPDDVIRCAECDRILVR